MLYPLPFASANGWRNLKEWIILILAGTILKDK
jgi:hypothetical protein